MCRAGLEGNSRGGSRFVAFCFSLKGISLLSRRLSYAKVHLVVLVVVL